MRKLLPLLAVALMMFTAACSDDESTTLWIPPSDGYKDKITLCEGLFCVNDAELTKYAVIVEEGKEVVGATKIEYGIHNETNETYLGTSFMATFPDNPDIEVTDNLNGKDMAIGSLTYPAVTIKVAPHTVASYKLNLNLLSSDEDTVTWPIQIITTYLLTPAAKNSEGKMDIVLNEQDLTGKSSQKFYIFNYGSNNVKITDLSFQNGTAGFYLMDSPSTDSDGVPNCYKGSSFASLSSHKHCFISVGFDNPVAGTHADTLNITQGNPAYKNSSIELKATVN